MILATGSDSPNLTEKVGLTPPHSLNFISTRFFVDRKKLEEDIPMDYMIHRHPDISSVGPMSLIKSNDYFNIAIVSDEKFSVMADKLLRILRNYKNLVGFLKHTKTNPKDMSSNDLCYGRTSRYPLSRFYSNNVVLIGEAAGLVSEVYVEGTLGAIGSAQILSQVIKAHKNSCNPHKSDNSDKTNSPKKTNPPDNSNKLPYPFTTSMLKIYEDRIRKEILGNLNQSSHLSEILFYKSGKYQYDIWDSYIQTMRKNKKVRKYIYNGWSNSDIEHYNLKNDDYVGERIFLNLPLSKKMLLSAFFLKLRFLWSGDK